MRIQGWCVSCRKVRPVKITLASMAYMGPHRRNMALGICADCEEKEREQK